VVPGLVRGAAAFVPAQPIVAPIKIAISSRPNCVRILRCRIGSPNNSRDDKAIVEPGIATPHSCWLPIAKWSLAVVDAAVVFTVSVAVTAAAPTIAGGLVTEHVGASAPSIGPPATAQLRATMPVKPPPGVIVMVDVALGPGDAMVTAELLIVKPGGGAATLTAKLVVALRPPAESAVTVTV